ncbi:DUF2306 domain-containing protein [Roseobacter sp.]|uniref:DUF2306 domain-containing protein n=1 Tax=Roseobacter sp. TaxID=1907202 RepID=UPI00385ABC83
MSSANLGAILTGVGIAVLMLVVLPFALHSTQLGTSGLFAPGNLETRFFASGQSFSNYAIFWHMLLGGVLTLLIPLQLLSALRNRWPIVHRWSGRFLCGCGLLTGVGGLGYITLRGTIGGVWMDAGFALYGVLLCLSAFQAIRYARAKRFADHRRWALRLFVLSMGSWLYRVHYGVWFALTDGIGSTPAFDGAFDLFQNVAFFLPYLFLLELWLRAGNRKTNA